jgi:hypothetical protein
LISSTNKNKVRTIGTSAVKPPCFFYVESSARTEGHH